jgi:hypothetical protein
MPRFGEVAVALSLALVAMAAGYALYGDMESAEADARQAAVAQPQWSALQTEPVGEPLRVANPFDSREVFEFPAGTSEADAHEAIVGFLLERATRRGVTRDQRHTAPKG